MTEKEQGILLQEVLEGKRIVKNKIKVSLRSNPLSSSYDVVAYTLFNTESESRVLTPSRASVNFFVPDFSLCDNIEK